jgi:hypothetical protein
MSDMYRYGFGGFGIIGLAAFMMPAKSFNDMQMSVNFPVEYVEKAMMTGVHAPFGFKKTSASSGRVVFEQRINNDHLPTFGGQVQGETMSPFKDGRVRLVFERGQPISYSIVSPSEQTSIRVRISVSAGAKKTETILRPTIAFTPGGIDSAKQKDIESYLSVINHEAAEEIAGVLRGAVVQSL